MLRTVAEVLDEMSRWEDVFVELYVRGVKGSMRGANSCPVAVYVHAQSGERVAVVPGGPGFLGYVSFWDRYPSDDLPLPHNLTDFVRDFDMGRYPELWTGSYGAES